MKRNHLGGALAMVLASALCAPTPGLAAQSSAPQRSPQPQTEQQPQTQQESPQQQAQPQSQAQPSQQGQATSQTFTGKIIKLTTGKFALLTGQSSDGKPTGHFLDDQENAQKFEGKQVTVTGTFDEASNMIHVTNIQAA